jgi:adenylate cyclase
MESPPKIDLSKKIRTIWAGTILMITLIIALAASSENGFLQSLDHFFYDRYMRMEASSALRSNDENQITIVDIDETSLAAVGQWPWPRYRLARLVRLIHQSDPRAMALDILFPEPDQSSLQNIIQRFETDLNVHLPVTDMPGGMENNDIFFGSVLADTSMVGARYFYFNHTGKGGVCKQTTVEITDPDNLLSLHQATGALCNTPAIETRLKNTGFINSQYDLDGLLRRIPLLIRHGSQIFPHLSLALFLEAQDISTARVIQTRTGPCIAAGTCQIPVTREGYAAIRFTRPGFSFSYLSAVDILNRQFEQSDLQDRIVLVGSSAMGLNDIHQTVLDPHFPGVEISAVLVDNILKNNLIIAPAWAGVLKGVACILTGLFMGGLFYRSFGPGMLFSVSLAWAAGLTGASLIAYREASVFISPAAPVVTVLVLFSLISLCRFTMEKRAAFTWYRQLSSALKTKSLRLPMRSRTRKTILPER